MSRFRIITFSLFAFANLDILFTAVSMGRLSSSSRPPSSSTSFLSSVILGTYFLATISRPLRLNIPKTKSLAACGSDTSDTVSAIRFAPSEFRIGTLLMPLSKALRASVSLRPIKAASDTNLSSILTRSPPSARMSTI